MSATSANALPQAISAVSPEFKKAATRSVIAIIGFIVVYFSLIALALGIVALSCWGGLSIIMLRPSFYTLLIGAGLMGAGVMIFIFLIKFLFATNKEDDSDSVEITAADQPELVQAIYELAEAIGTPKPKKIFLSPDVNACVFYNSSFWSMFFPVRKNLKIGLGLVNALNVSELKAVIAHEFGHFSQRSMKVGSWVYSVNKIIYNMLFNNTGYANSLQSMANVHGIFSFFAMITARVVQGIQWVLHQVFRMVNKTYMSLSRQMEFHADLIAASVCGSNNIINSLLRIEYAQLCFNSTMEMCNKAWKDKAVVNNFYNDHGIMLKKIAQLNNISLVDGLPVLEDRKAVHTNRINYKDQWASHPTTPERKAYLDQFELASEVNTASAWSLFTNAEELKATMTQHFYNAISKEEIKSELDEKEFEQIAEKHFKDNSLPGLFKEFYNDRQVATFDAEAVALQPFTLVSFDQVLSEDAAVLPRKVQMLQQDIAVLKGIINKEIQTDSFDFDGQKYPRKKAAEILAILESELEKDEKELQQLDATLFRYFYAIAPFTEAEALKVSWKDYFSNMNRGDQFLNNANRIVQLLAPVFQGQQLQIEHINAMSQDLKQNQEPGFKKELQYWHNQGAFNDDAALKETLEKFIASDYQYFSGNSFFDTELIALNHLVHGGWELINSCLFKQFKSITETQAAIYTNKMAAELIR